MINIPKCETTDCGREATHFVQMDMSPGYKHCTVHAFQLIGSYMAGSYAYMYAEELMDGRTSEERDNK